MNAKNEILLLVGILLLVIILILLWQRNLLVSAFSFSNLAGWILFFWLLLAIVFFLAFSGWLYKIKILSSLLSTANLNWLGIAYFVLSLFLITNIFYPLIPFQTSTLPKTPVSDSGKPSIEKTEEVTILSSINAPGQNPLGLTWDGSYLWVADVDESKLYQLDPGSGRVMNSIYTGPERGWVWASPNGLTWDGNYLWISDSGEGKIIKVDKSTGSPVSTFDFPSTYILSDMAWDGNFFWVADWFNDKIYKIDPSSGTVVESIDAPSDFISGLAWDGSNLWVSDSDNGTLYKVDTSTGSVIFSHSLGISYLEGLAWDGANLWCVSNQEGKIYKLGVK